MAILAGRHAARILLFTGGLAATVVSGSGALPGAAPEEPGRPQERLALVGGRIYPAPGVPPIPDGVVLITNGTIAAVGPTGSLDLPPGLTLVDCSGATVAAGFWNSHVHFLEPKWGGAATLPPSQLASHLTEMLTRYGFTNVVDTGSFLEITTAIRSRIRSGEVAGPGILTAGEPIFPKGGLPYYAAQALSPEQLRRLPQAATAEEAVTIVDDQIGRGGDAVKLYAVSWVSRREKRALPLEAAAAAADRAHALGKLVFVHPTDVEGLRIALRCRADVLAHAVEDLRGWDESLRGEMKSGRMALVPTLKLLAGPPHLRLLRWVFARLGVVTSLDAILRFVGDYAREGGEILFGTDVGYLSDYDPAEEYALMIRAGLSFDQILASLTTAPAARFGREASTGRIAPGMDADLVVLWGDPAADAREFASVRLVLRGGRVIYESHAPSSRTSWLPAASAGAIVALLVLAWRLARRRTRHA